MYVCRTSVLVTLILIDLRSLLSARWRELQVKEFSNCWAIPITILTNHLLESDQ